MRHPPLPVENSEEGMGFHPTADQNSQQQQQALGGWCFATLICPFAPGEAKRGDTPAVVPRNPIFSRGQLAAFPLPPSSAALVSFLQ